MEGGCLFQQDFQPCSVNRKANVLLFLSCYSNKLATAIVAVDGGCLRREHRFWICMVCWWSSVHFAAASVELGHPAAVGSAATSAGAGQSSAADPLLPAHAVALA